MGQYVDGFVLCVPRKNLKVYKRMAGFAAKLWVEHGALQYVECLGDDVKGIKGALAFPKLAKPRKGEAILFSWIMYKSKAHRNAVNKKVMQDKRLNAYKDMPMPFDMKRMAYGGFKAIVNKGGKR